MACIERFARQADRRGVDVLLFPECFLQGYLVESAHVSDDAQDLGSGRFAQVLRRLEGGADPGVRGHRCSKAADTSTPRSSQLTVGSSGPTVEQSLAWHKVEASDAYPTFEVRGVRFGINICYDTQFPAAAAAVAAQGAKLLLVPAQNMMRRAAATR